MPNTGAGLARLFLFLSFFLSSLRIAANGQLPDSCDFCRVIVIYEASPGDQKTFQGLLEDRLILRPMDWNFL